MPRSGSCPVLLRSVTALAAAASAGFGSLAYAGSPGSEGRPAVEAWTGAEVFQRVWSLYGGATYAPFGSVRQDGFRLRAVGGYGAYSYLSPRWTGAGTQTLEFNGTVTFADLLAGYHKQLGPITIKIFAGLTVADHATDDPETRFGGTRLGGKAAIETWWNITEQTWTSLDLSWTTLDNVYGARGRLGRRLWPSFSAGIEAGITGNRDYDTSRFGGFVRYEWASGEISVSGGIVGEGPSSGRIDIEGPFATINVLGRF